MLEQEGEVELWPELRSEKVALKSTDGPWRSLHCDIERSLVVKNSLLKSLTKVDWSEDSPRGSKGI